MRGRASVAPRPDDRAERGQDQQRQNDPSPMNSRFFMTMILSHKTREVVTVFPTPAGGLPFQAEPKF
jgi:hypothetical protein